MSGDWYVRRDDQQWGPISLREFDELRAMGRLLSTDWVWQSGWPDWRRWEEVSSDARSQAIPPPIPITGLTRPTSLPREAIEAALQEHFDNLGLSRRGRQKSEYAALIRDLVQKSTPRDTTALQSAIRSSEELVYQLWSACRRRDNDAIPNEPDERLEVVWRHRDLTTAFKRGYTSDEACPISRESLSVLANDYLNQELRSGRFEALLVDAMVASETYEYGEELKSHPSRFEQNVGLRLFKMFDEIDDYGESKGDFEKLQILWLKRGSIALIRRIAVFWLLPIIIIYGAFQAGYPTTGGVVATLFAIGVALNVIGWAWRKLRSLFRDEPKSSQVKAFELHAQMVEAYFALKDGAASSPTRVREVLAKAADHGAAWDASVFSLLDTAIARSPGHWA